MTYIVRIGSKEKEECQHDDENHQWHEFELLLPFAIRSIGRTLGSLADRHVLVVGIVILVVTIDAMKRFVI